MRTNHRERCTKTPYHQDAECGVFRRTRADFEVLLGLLGHILEFIGAAISVVSDSIQYLLLPLQFTVHLLQGSTGVVMKVSLNCLPQ